jgi:hypothetical protein
MQTGLDPSSLAAALAEVGLTLREHLGPEQIQARYFAHRHDGYRAFEHVHFAAAALAEGGSLLPTIAIQPRGHF